MINGKRTFIFPCLLASCFFIVGCSSDSTSSPDGGAGGDAAASSGCNTGEPNNTREAATVLNLNTAYAGLCVGNEADPIDFYEITAPATDLAGGVVQVQIRNVDASVPEFTVYAVSDNTSLLNVYTTTDGANIDGWFSVAPGAKYRVAVQKFAGANQRFTYSLTLKYTPYVDAYEPNNTRETAKPIVVGTPIMASAAVAPVGAEVAAGEVADWYAVTLAGGTATVTVSNVPADTLCDITIYDATNTDVGSVYNTTEGGNCTKMLEGLVGGPYLIKYEKFAGAPPRAGDKAALPPTQTAQYKLLVSQP